METTNLTPATVPQTESISGLIAVVGCDGTGKSTLTTDLVKQLQMQWVTERRYLGLLSGEDGDKIKKLPLIGVWLERRLAAKSSKTQSMKNRSPALWAALIMFAFSLRRRVKLRRVQQLTQRGVLVVSDRFPQAEISGFYYDGPGIGIERATGKIKQRLAARETLLYQNMARYQPDLIIRLMIDVETAFSRKPDHDYEELRDKIDVMSRINYNGSRIIELDARAPYAEVLKKALSAASEVAAISKRQRVAN
ncbi:hypothetical protein DBY68_018405 [Pseudocitrobacter sp. RIT415]|uniref:Thymidylate kinase n=1 Tax=Pseudocitrobacter faecalis TaxID=1398493 RepID=A0ABX9FTW3_9ENTR|nr:hypothetical protein [Pseudocitrobacter sp. RIT 415]RAU44230.1 hypothetical protein DBY68_018405 [Pseudocitrobacter sp. RIT 415]RBP07258.1 thymidylate kinase [Pseudocitrobacter faecalis]